MKNLFLINEDEKKRILNLHESATKKQYLKEESEIDEVDWGAVGTATAAGAAVGAAGFGVGAIPGAIIGGAGALIAQLISGSASKDGAEKILQACKNTKEVGKPTMTSASLTAIADGINTAIEGMGTDEDAVKANLEKLETIPDLCAMATKYETRHGESLFDAIDGDFDSQSDWKKYVFLPLLDLQEKSEELGKKVTAAPAQTGTVTAAPAQTGKVSGKSSTSNKATSSVSATKSSAPSDADLDKYLNS